MKKKSYYVHQKALVESDYIGEGTNIWAFVHILKGAIIGQNCNIGNHCYIEENVTIGNDVVIKNGISIWSGVIVEDLVFIGPNVSFTNDKIPRAKVYRKEYDKILIKIGASIGANATLIAPIVIGEYAIIGAGSVITKDVPDYGLFYGNPAKLKAWVCKCGKKLLFDNDKKTMCSCRNKFILNQNEKVKCQTV